MRGSGVVSRLWWTHRCRSYTWWSAGQGSISGLWIPKEHLHHHLSALPGYKKYEGVNSHHSYIYIHPTKGTLYSLPYQSTHCKQKMRFTWNCVFFYLFWRFSRYEADLLLSVDTDRRGDGLKPFISLWGRTAERKHSVTTHPHRIYRPKTEDGAYETTHVVKFPREYLLFLIITSLREWRSAPRSQCSAHSGRPLGWVC